ncbi:CDP-diacylglycerol--glycerol-3-phosphate 3-phosphatidyltransferase [Amedibacillus sp. YH-ame10]
MNLPNKLSMFRILLVPIIACVALFYDGQVIIISMNDISANLSTGSLLVLVLFAVASFTDFLDGNIARKRGLVTSFGKFIDPIADKLLVNTMFILFAVQGVIPVFVTLVMIWRDMMVDGMRMNASASGKIVAAGMLGKIKTVLQMFAIIVLLLQNMPFVFFHIPMDTILLWGALIVSVVSGIQYFWQLKDILMESM